MSEYFIDPWCLEDLSDEFLEGRPLPEELLEYLRQRYGSYYMSPAFADIMRCVEADVSRYEYGELELPPASGKEPRIRLPEGRKDRLVELMLAHIKKQRLEIVALRYVASFAMEEEYGEGLRQDILCDLTGDFEFDDAYIAFINKYYKGVSPVDYEPFNAMLRRLAKGDEDYGLPFSYIAFLKRGGNGEGHG